MYDYSEVEKKYLKTNRIIKKRAKKNLAKKLGFT